MSSASDPIDQAFPDTTPDQPFKGDPIDVAFAPKDEKPSGASAALREADSLDPTVSKAINSKWNPLNWPQMVADRGADELASGSLHGQVTNPEAKNPENWSQPEPGMPLAATALKLVPAVAGMSPILRGLGGRTIPEAPPPTMTADQVVAQSRSAQSMGAAADGGAGTVSRLSPETQAEIVNANRNGSSINQTALERHADAESLPLPDGTGPLRLRKGQATGDAQQISDEKNLRADPDTQGILSDSITDQDKKLVASMGEIRRQATPDIVQRINSEHDQAAIDAIKSQDNAMVLDTRAKYKALSDANGGSIPIDTGTAISGIDAQLQKGYLTKTAQSNPVVSSVMDDLRSGNPLDFESFENARSRLADVQRQGGSDGVAAGIVRNQLENLPLPPEAAPLKNLADAARSSAKAHFDWIKQNPAVKAAVNDNVPKENGLHDIGAPSPLAGGFLDRFALGNGPNASPAYVQRLKQAVPDPVLSDSIEAATLNKLRDAAGIDSTGNGSFRNDQFRNAVNALESKEGVLLKPETSENIQQLKRVSGYVNDEGGKANTVSRSNTALNLQRYGAQYGTPPTVTGAVAGYGADLAASHLGPVGILGKRIVGTALKNSQDAKAIQSIKDAKLQFATDATKPGAGIAQ